VETLLKSALPLAQKESGTTRWFAIKFGPGRYGIYDTFKDETGRGAHFNGEVAKALFGRADELYATPPQVEQLEILAEKA
jgi:quinol monooxygenase YgiN